VASPGALKGLLAGLRAEQEKRARARGREFGETVRESFYRQLDTMRERLTAAPGYAEPSAAQKAAAIRDLAAYLDAHYGLAPGRDEL
jgi:hypothetical protein